MSEETYYINLLVSGIPDEAMFDLLEEITATVEKRGDCDGAFSGPASEHEITEVELRAALKAAREDADRLAEVLKRFVSINTEGLAEYDALETATYDGAAALATHDALKGGAK